MLRKTFFVKPRLQIKYLLLTLGTVLITAICVYFAMDQGVSQLESSSKITMNEIVSMRSTLRVSFLWILSILLLVLGIESIFIFHRLLGPAYALEKIMRLVGKGDLKVIPRLRKDDDLKDLAEVFDEMISNLRRKVEADRAVATEVAQKISDPQLKERLYRIGTGFRLED